MTIYNIEYRPVQLPGGPEARWLLASNLRPATREEADRKVDACRRAMPMREYRVTEIHYNEKPNPETGVYDDDIPF